MWQHRRTWSPGRSAVALTQGPTRVESGRDDRHVRPRPVGFTARLEPAPRDPEPEQARDDTRRHEPRRWWSL